MLGEPEKYPDHIVITPLCPACSYCGDKMNFATARVKRPVPPGAKDLNIYDEQNYWQCRQCNAISTECLSRCECGQLTIDFPAFGRAEGHREIPPQTIVENHEAGLFGYFCNYRNYQDDIFGFKCISCARCNQCSKELKATRFVQTGIYSEHNKSEVAYKFYHEACFPDKQRSDEQNKLKAKRLEQQKNQEARSREGRERAAKQITKTIIWAILSYPIVGLGGCFVRFAGAPIYPPHDPRYNVYESQRAPFQAFTYEAVYAPFIIIALGMLIAALTLILSRRKREGGAGNFFSYVFIALVVGVIIYFGNIAVGSMNVRDKLARTFNWGGSSVATGDLKETSQTKTAIKADKVTKGRTANEKVHEFVLPPNEWVETSLQITPNQEVLVHHFTSNEPVKVNLGGVTDTRLQKAGTILPLYTSKNCSNDPGVKAKVAYYCVQLNQPESLKLYANNSVRVGVAVKNR